jgi:transcription-repair coupling factor (superfamily II helicase)
MSLSGIRDMSVLSEPPLERIPVQTYVMEYDADSVRDAIYRELTRNGQVYYLHNRVRNIHEVAARVQKLAPDAVVAYAHGQMGEHELENVMMDFINGEIDVLVCTTIIESGLDIQNVNTIIIQDSDYLGLAQLYQLRGRVGRSNRIAYCYLMYQRDKVLTEASEKRLDVIKAFTEFGAGFKIAMRDLSMRGAGNILGAEQHGHMDAVGYEMYLRLLDEAMRRQRGGSEVRDSETLIDLQVTAYIPSSYIPDEVQRLDIYRRIAQIIDDESYLDVQDELIDRFGDLPACVQSLLDIALLKAAARKLDAVSVTQKAQNLVVTFPPDARVAPEKLAESIKRHNGMLVFSASANPQLTYKGLDMNGLKKALLEMA